MKKGDIVTIYQDPMTEKCVEGKAKLLKRVFEREKMDSWQVKFLGGEDGDPIVYRFIKKKGE